MLEARAGDDARLSLRARLVLGVLVLAAAGLSPPTRVTYTSLRSFLLDRVDSTLDADHQGAERAGRPAGLRPRAAALGPRLRPDPLEQPARSSTRPRAPHFPGDAGAVAAEAAGDDRRSRRPPNAGPDRVTYLHRAGGRRRRPLPRPRLDRARTSTDVLIVATSLSGVDGTLHRLLPDRALRHRSACSPAIVAARALDRPARPAAARGDREDRRPDHRRRPLAAASSARSPAPRSGGSGSR